jgi:hypothetical protein
MRVQIVTQQIAAGAGESLIKLGACRFERHMLMQFEVDRMRSCAEHFLQTAQDNGKT